MSIVNEEHTLRQQLVDHAQQLGSSGLSLGTSGNLSARCGDYVLITPSAVPYHALTPARIVAIGLDGQLLGRQEWQPSSEWRFHCALYRRRRDIAAIVHSHPPACTALACTAREIPPFHYMVAVAGGHRIPLADYALFGSERLSEQICDTLGDLNACLLANHGMIAAGKSLDRAFALAREVENLADQYTRALQLGDVKLLSDAEMDAVLERFTHYGR